MKQEFCIDIELDRPNSDEVMSKEDVKLFLETAIKNQGITLGTTQKGITAHIGYIGLMSDTEEEQIEGLDEEEIEGT